MISTKKHTLDEFNAAGDDPLITSASACIVFSLVPWIGILFIPFSLFLSVVSLVSRRRALRAASRPLIYLLVSFAILAIQVGLWSIFYMIRDLETVSF